MTTFSRLMLGACITVATASAALPAAAEGAFALGIKSSDPRLGVSYGASYNFATVAEAKYEALALCLKQNTPAEIRAECKVIATFRNACLTVAWDPGAGEPGFGWSQDADRASSERKALEQCSATAGARKNACIVHGTYCDVTNEQVASGRTPAQLAVPAGGMSGGGARR